MNQTLRRISARGLVDSKVVALSIQRKRMRNKMLRTRTQRNGKYFVISAKKHKIITDQFFPPVIFFFCCALSILPYYLPRTGAHHLILMTFDIFTYDLRAHARSLAESNHTTDAYFCSPFFIWFARWHSAMRSYDVHFSINHKQP